MPGAQGAVSQRVQAGADDMKFRPCATLFALASGERDNPFQRAFDRWCNGRLEGANLTLTRHEN